MSGKLDVSEGHCDDYIDDFRSPICLRWWLFVNRLAAIHKALAEESGVAPKLFADYEGDRVRCVMASRLGDIGITRKLDAERGYEKRLLVRDLTNFSDVL